MKKVLVVMAVLLGLSIAAQADISDVSFILSGYAYNWTYNFHVKNNMPNEQDVYSFGVKFDTHDIVGSPTGWDEGVANSDYNNLWTSNSLWTNNFPQIINGATSLSGFKVHSNKEFPDADINWFASNGISNYSGIAPLLYWLYPQSIGWDVHVLDESLTHADVYYFWGNGIHHPQQPPPTNSEIVSVRAFYLNYENNSGNGAVPEPGTILAALSILTPAGLIFRRRK